MRRFAAVHTGVAAALTAPAILAALLAVQLPARAEAKPRSVVSINLCTDELVLRLADSGQVKSVTWLARDSLGSAVRALAGAMPVNRGLAEEIVPLSPDLVVAGIHTTRTTVGFLKRIGIPVIELGVPGTLDEVRAQIRMVATVLGNAAAGEAMIAALDTALSEGGAVIAGSRPTALVLRPNGFTAGRGSLVDTLLDRAGLANLAADLQTDGLGQLPLERIVAARPDVLIINADADAPESMAQALLDHPALASLKETATVVEVPTRLWTCAGPQLAEAMALLKSAAAKARSRPNPQTEAVR